MVTQEEIRQARLEAMRRSGALDVQQARAEALRAGAPSERVAKVIADYYTGKLSPGQAARILRSLAKNGNGR
ncbi:MAG: hypothetical protein GSR78_02585 [Desulfurococcales archaeon]|nr:hypothetical protein [Desulfurococcales archaeon]